MSIGLITSVSLEKICEFASGRKYASLRQETQVIFRRLHSVTCSLFCQPLGCQYTKHTTRSHTLISFDTVIGASMLLSYFQLVCAVQHQKGTANVRCISQCPKQPCGLGTKLHHISCSAGIARAAAKAAGRAGRSAKRTACKRCHYC